jgi:hypothetical protein
VWCMVCGVWCVVCGMWYVVCGVWCVWCLAKQQQQQQQQQLNNIHHTQSHNHTITQSHNHTYTHTHIHTYTTHTQHIHTYTHTRTDPEDQECRESLPTQHPCEPMCHPVVVYLRPVWDQQRVPIRTHVLRHGRYFSTGKNPLKPF